MSWNENVIHFLVSCSFIPPAYPYNVDPNFGPVSIVASEEAAKLAGHPGLPPSSQAQQLSGISIKEERLKESPSPHEQPKHMAPQQQVSLELLDQKELLTQKSVILQLLANKVIKQEPMTKQEIKQEPNPTPGPQHQPPSQPAAPQPQQPQPPPPQPQQPHALHPKDLQALGAYPAIYQRHSMNLAVQQARDEELRR